MLFNFKRDKDTICAQSTPPGHGGVAIVRVSVSQAHKIVCKIAPFLPEKPESHRMYYGFLCSENNRKIDEVLVSYFKEGRSFTGEETFEINCHGGEVVVNWVLEELIRAGARIAEPGEFSYRSFLNGKMDLVQAEAVLSLIQSQSKKAAQLAVHQLEGGLSEELIEIEDIIIWSLAQLEADIDFSDEDIEVVSWKELKEKLERAHMLLGCLVKSFESGRKLTEGLRITIVGEPNVGKSSLLNALVKEEKAIVTDIPGTTRDVIETTQMINGVNVKFVDTAGIHETEDVVESMGIERAKAQFAKSDLILLVCENSFRNSEKFIAETTAFGRDEDVLLVLNKVDLLDGVELEENMSSYKSLKVSARTREGFDDLNEWLSLRVKEKTEVSLSTTLTSSRQFEQVAKAHEFVSESLILVDEGASPDLIAFELQESLQSIHEVLGKHSDEDVLDRVFKEFCLGK